MRTARGQSGRNSNRRADAASRQREALPEGLEALIVFVVNATQAEQVLFDGGGLARVAPGGVMLGCTTVAPEAAREFGRRVEGAGAAVSGRAGLGRGSGGARRQHDGDGERQSGGRSIGRNLCSA